jgi:hypothetical protein
MDLDAKQTRNFFLAGTVAFPKPFASSGTISLFVGGLTYSRGQAPQNKDLVLVQDFNGNRTVVRLMLQRSVKALFVPGERNAGGVFQISYEPVVEDFDLGEWFLDSDVNEATIRARLNLQPQDDIATRNSILRGIVFVATDQPIVHITEVAQTAGDDLEMPDGYPCCQWESCCQ